MKNPVILLNHNSGAFPIGRTLAIINNRSECRCELLPHTYCGMVGEKRTKELRNLIRRTKEVNHGTDFKGNLLELSIINI